MSDPGFQYFRAAGQRQWHVHYAGRFIGTIVERSGGWQATRLVDSEQRVHRFPNREAAAVWLAKLAG